MQAMQDKTIKELAKDCRSVEDVHEMLKNLFKDTLQQIFETEIEEHLGYKKHSIEGNTLETVVTVTTKKLSKPSSARQK